MMNCRYQALTRERDALNSRWDEQHNLLVQSHERVIQDLTEEYEQKLQEEQVLLCMLCYLGLWFRSKVCKRSRCHCSYLGT